MCASLYFPAAQLDCVALFAVAIYFPALTLTKHLFWAVAPDVLVYPLGHVEQLLVLP